MTSTLGKFRPDLFVFRSGIDGVTLGGMAYPLASPVLVSSGKPAKHRQEGQNTPRSC